MNNKVSIIILAAGKGTRMKSDLPKTLHKITSKSMLDLVIAKAKMIKADSISIVISQEMQKYCTQITKNHKNTNIEFVIQKERLGTAHAVKTALESSKNIANKVMILYGDSPLIELETLEKMLSILDNKDLCILGFDCKKENKYGRLVVNGDILKKIVEYKDANIEEKKITLCNSGVIGVKHKNLLQIINKIENNNASKEYYLTDIVEIMNNEGLNSGFITAQEEEVLGVNSRQELAKAENIAQSRLRNKFMDAGVTLIDPNSVYFASDTIIENDVIIEPNVFFGPQVVIKKGTIIKSFSHLENAIISQNSAIGPFARIRPGTKIGDNCKIGNFVEIKNSNIGDESKIGHLSYIGDSKLGENVNIGAGTITCNYDGHNKHQTIIENNSFIGSNSSIIAPVTIEEDCLIAAGSTITQNVKKGDLAISRTKQINIDNGSTRYHLDRKN